MQPLLNLLSSFYSLSPSSSVSSLPTKARISLPLSYASPVRHVISLMNFVYSLPEIFDIDIRFENLIRVTRLARPLTDQDIVPSMLRATNLGRLISHLQAGKASSSFNNCLIITSYHRRRGSFHHAVHSFVHLCSRRIAFAGINSSRVPTSVPRRVLDGTQIWSCATRGRT